MANVPSKSLEILASVEWLWAQRGKNLYLTPTLLTPSNSDSTSPKLTFVEALSVFSHLEDKGLLFRQTLNSGDVYLIHEEKVKEWTEFIHQLRVNGGLPRISKVFIYYLGELMITLWIASDCFKETFKSDLSHWLLFVAFICATCVTGHQLGQCLNSPKLIRNSVILLVALALIFVILGISKQMRSSQILVTIWTPPELPIGRTNVILSLGSDRFSIPLPSAKGFGNAVLPLRELPSSLQQGITEAVSYSPRISDYDISSVAELTVGGLAAGTPALPLVESNRYFVKVHIPFLDGLHTIEMNSNLDSRLAALPRRWDRNYDPLAYEIVDGFTNPILQVIYKSAYSIQINGAFIVNTNAVLLFFGDHPKLFARQVPAIWAGLVPSITPKDFSAFIHKEYPTNKTLFKYPSWAHAGERRK